MFVKMVTNRLRPFVIGDLENRDISTKVESSSQKQNIGNGKTTNSPDLRSSLVDKPFMDDAIPIPIIHFFDRMPILRIGRKDNKSIF